MESQSTTRPTSTRRLRSSAPATAPRPGLTEPTGPSLARDGDSTDDSLAMSSQHQQDIDSASLRLMHADGNLDREGASNPSVMEPPAESVRRKPARASRRTSTRLCAVSFATLALYFTAHDLFRRAALRAVVLHQHTALCGLFRDAGVVRTAHDLFHPPAHGFVRRLSQRWHCASQHMTAGIMLHST